MLASAGGPAFAGGDPDKPSPRLDAAQAALASKQELVLAVADQVKALGSSASGALVQVEVSPETKGVTVYWYGRKSRELDNLVAAARGRGVAVLVKGAPFSPAELAAARRLVVVDGRASTVSTKKDGSAIAVGVRSAALLHAFPAEVAGVPLELSVADPVPLSRWADTRPFYGGGAIISDQTGAACSTAFGAHDSGGHMYMISADHCRPGLYRTPTGLVVGTSKIWDADRDVLAIDTDDGRYLLPSTSPSSGNRVYAGAADMTGAGIGETTRVVRGSGSFVLGEYVCTSGAFSGERCSNRVVLLNDTINIGYPLYNMIMLENVNHANAAGQGDSGGPIYPTNPDGTVTAKGVVSAGDVTNARAACTGDTSPDRECAWRIWSSPLSTSLSVLRLSVNIG